MTPGQWRAVKDGIQAEIDGKKEHMATGIASWDLYRSATGYVAGLRQALDIADRVLNPPKPREENEE